MTVNEAAKKIESKLLQMGYIETFAKEKKREFIDAHQGSNAFFASHWVNWKVSRIREQFELNGEKQ